MKRQNVLYTVSKSFLILLILSGVLMLSAQESDMLPGQIDATIEMARARFQSGCTLYNQYSYLGAVEFFRQAVSLYPEYHLAREYLARSYRLAGYTDEALTEWELLYQISRDPLVKNKIDMIRYQRIVPYQKAQAQHEYIEYQTIDSNTMGRFHFSYPVDIAIDENKNVYISSFSTGKIVKFNSKGEGVKTLKTTVNSQPFGIDFHDGRIVVSDFKNETLHLLSENLEKLHSFGRPGSGDGEFHGAQGVCFDSAGLIYAVDSGNNRIQKFKADGTYLFDFGKGGSYEGELASPTDVVEFDGKVYVSDTGNKRIAVFDESGNFLYNLTNDLIESPRGLTLHEGNLIISDSKTGLIQYNLLARSYTLFSSWELAGKDEKNEFTRLYAAAYDRDGYLYTLDHGSELVTIFTQLQKSYSNIDVEISSVDTAQFPKIAFYISVRDREGAPIYALSNKDFYLTEDNAKIKKLYIDYLKSKEATNTIIFCTDKTSSMEKWHQELAWSADEVLKKLLRDDKVKVVNFAEEYYTELDFDWSRRRILKAMSEKNYKEEDAAVGRVLYNSISELLKTETRRAVVLFSDGELDSTSFEQYSADVVADYAKSHFIPIYIVTLSKTNDEFKMIAEKTGGALIEARHTNQLQSLYSSIKEQEEHRYVVVYETFKDTTFSKWWSNVSIEVELKGQRGIEWGGYYVP